MERALSAASVATLEISDVVKKMSSDTKGLSDQEAAQRLRIHGKNRIKRTKRTGLLHRLIGQLTSPLILVLVVVAAIVPFIGHPKDALIIVFVLIFNTVIGVIQEGKASRALEALEHTFVETCSVLRDGKTLKIPAQDIVPGDLVLLQEGDRIPADGRFIEAAGLRVEEASLTGESTPVDKTASVLAKAKGMTLGDIANAGFAQTLVVAGKGTLLVTATGNETEVGKIAAELSGHQTEPPLAKKVRRLSQAIAVVVLLFSVALYVIGILSGRPALPLFATIISLAVSVIPEGLPIVLTLVLARGVSHMAAKNAVVKKMNAVEGLGQVQVICTDKTGTLTTNELVVQQAWVAGKSYEVHGQGFNPDGEVEDPKALAALALAARLFGDSALRKDADGSWKAVGDPVNAALLVFALRAGITTDTGKIIEELPFDYATRRRSARWELDGKQYAFMVGSPEGVQAACAGSSDSNIQEAVQAAARQGLRVIALAGRDGNLSLSDKTPWKHLGFVAMGDTLRPRVIESVAWCRAQGIRVVMITGDHPDTALAIAQTAGIAEDESQVVNGADLESMSDEDLREALEGTRVFSRIAPTHKLRIINAYRSAGLLTAMTGDGVNDAPALHRADIGIAMGKGGTDVAREAAHLVLMDDNFATIVLAIQEGRATIANVRRVIMYLFSTSIAEAGLISATLITGLPLPLLPGQIIWINLVTDSFLDVSLGLEPRHGSREQHASGALIDRRAIVRMVLLGGTMSVGTFIVYANALDTSTAHLQTLTLTTLAVFQWFNAWNARSETKSLAQLSLVSNKPLLAATGIVITLQLLAVYAPPFQQLLGTVPLPLADWGIILGLATTVILVDEIWKKVRHKPRTKTIAV